MNTMTASMSFKGLKVSLEADRELTFKEIFKLHQLVTGNDDEYSKMFAHSKDPEIPAAYSTVHEIKAYLDKKDNCSS